MLEALQHWFANPTVQRLVEVGAGLLIIVALVRGLSHWAGRAVHDTDARYRIRKGIAFLGYLAAAVVIATVYSTRLTGLTVAFGVAGAGVAFALQEVIASVAGWVALTFSRFYGPGDRVQVGGIKGDVIDIGVLRTTLLEMGEWVRGDLYNGRIVRVANSFVFKEPVFNYSADFPFLWDEIRLPIRHGGDRVLARRLIETTVREAVGEYAEFAKQSWTRMLRSYRLEEAQVEPMVTMTANENWLEFTIRYVVDYRRRRSVQDALFTRLLAAIDGTAGQVAIASASIQVITVPPASPAARGATPPPAGGGEKIN